MDSRSFWPHFPTYAAPHPCDRDGTLFYPHLPNPGENCGYSIIIFIREEAGEGVLLKLESCTAVLARLTSSPWSLCSTFLQHAPPPPHPVTFKQVFWVTPPHFWLSSCSSPGKWVKLSHSCYIFHLLLLVPSPGRLSLYWDRWRCSWKYTKWENRV